MGHVAHKQKFSKENDIKNYVLHNYLLCYTHKKLCIQASLQNFCTLINLKLPIFTLSHKRCFMLNCTSLQIQNQLSSKTTPEILIKG